MADSPRALMVPVAEAAEVLGVCVNTLKRAGEDGEIQLRRIRSVYLVPLAWLASFTAWPASEDAVPAAASLSPHATAAGTASRSTQ